MWISGFGFDFLSDLDTNFKDGYQCHDGLWLVGFDCLFDLDTNVKDGYKCHDGLINLDTNVKDGYKCYSLIQWAKVIFMDINIEDGYRLDLIVEPIWIQMLMIDNNARVGFQWAQVIFMDTNVDDEIVNCTQFWFYYWTNLDTKVNDGYES